MSLPRCIAGFASLARYLPHLFVLALALITALSLMPAPAVPQVFQFWDKAQHALAYAALAACGCGAFPSRARRVAAGLLIHGALIEVLQGTLTSTRYADITDWFADAIGISIGMLLVLRLIPTVTRRLQARG